MNKFSKIITVLLVVLGTTFLGSCVKEKFDAPTITAPTVAFTANTTIATINQLADSLSTLTPAFGIISNDLIIEGVVVGNDESGNIYKNLYIEDNTGGIDIAIDASGLYTTYRVGQKVIVKCQGLYIGNYGGTPELGYISAGAIGRIPIVFLKDHLFLDGFPGNPPVPTTTSIIGIESESPVNTLSTLIRLDSVFFVPDVISVIASPLSSATNHTVNDKSGSSLVIRTSNYATFAGKLVPSGYGSVVGILSYFNKVYQFTIRDTNDFIGFGGPCPLFLSETFTSTLGSFTAYSVTGAEVWTGTKYGATMSGYNGGNKADEDWLISPSFNLNNYTTPTLSFQSTMNYGSAGDGSLRLFYSTDYVSGAPSTGTWTELTGFALSAGTWAVTQSGNIDLSAISGTNVHIAFKYLSTTSNAPTWEIANVLGKGTPK